MEDKLSEKIIRARIEESSSVKILLPDPVIKGIALAANAIWKCISRGGKVLIFGNGGSAADSQHMASEFVGRFTEDRKALPAIALTTNSSIITAVANDLDYDDVFSRQIEALGRKGDIAMAITTSGNSPNVLKAMVTARKMGIETIALAGGSGGKVKFLADRSIVVSTSRSTPRIQEAHITIIHIISELVESRFFKSTGEGRQRRKN